MKHLLHIVVYKILRFALLPVMKIKYGFRTDRIPRIGGPFILVSNHTTEEDMFFAGIASRRHLYFVCGEHLLRNKVYGRALRILADPIPVPKGGMSLAAVREILRRIREGRSICLFPEGKRSFHGETIPASAALGKLVKKAGCTLVTYRIRGGYFTYPRWARDHHRKGHVEGKVMGVYSPEDLAGMTAGEVTALINRDTYENACAVQREKMWRYTGKDLARGMEHILFLCPKCGAMDTIGTEGDRFFCSACGMEGIYDQYGFLKGEGLPFDDVHSWMRWIEPRFDRFVLEHTGNEELFAEKDVLLYRMEDGYRNEDVCRGTLAVSREEMRIGDHRFPFGEITSMALLFGNILLFTHRNIYYGLTGDAFRAWKCGRLWHLTCGDTGDPTREL